MNLSGSIPVEIGQLTSLRSLDFSDNQITGPIPDAIGALTKLETLNLNHNEIEGEIPTAIGALTKLETLNLGHNNLSGNLPSEMKGLASLEELQLQDNKLVGEIPSDLKDLFDDIFCIELDGNALESSDADLNDTINWLTFLDDWHSEQNLGPAKESLTFDAEANELHWTNRGNTNEIGWHVISFAKVDGCSDELKTESKRNTMIGLDLAGTACDGEALSGLQFAIKMLTEVDRDDFVESEPVEFKVDTLTEYSASLFVRIADRLANLWASTF